MSALEIVDVGWSTTIQDAGRAGRAAIGVPPSGALDGATRDLLNRLVGNPPDAATLETAGRLRVRAIGPCTVAMSSELAPRAVNDGDVVTVDPANGDLWGYVAARGGFDVPAVLGSRSQDTLSRLGPPALTAGQRLPIGRDPGTPVIVDQAAVVERRARAATVWPGPRLDWFAADAMQQLVTTDWTVSADVSRIGVRLDGPPLRRIVEDELPSEGLITGAIQVPPDGRPVVMLADHPTTGGYPSSLWSIRRACASLPSVAPVRRCDSGFIRWLAGTTRLGVRTHDRPSPLRHLHGALPSGRGEPDACHRARPVSSETKMWNLTGARLHLRPYSDPLFDVAVPAVASPTGPRLAGKYGIGLLSIGATQAVGFDVLGLHWDVMEERAETFGTTADRSQWRLVGLMHIAETKAQAEKDVEYGIRDWFDYFQHTAAFPQMDVSQASAAGEMIEFVNSSGLGSIGTADMACEQIERLQKQSGGCGCYMTLCHEWANPEVTKRSYELIAQRVFPEFQGHAAQTRAAKERARAGRERLAERNLQAVQDMVDKHEAELAGKLGPS